MDTVRALEEAVEEISEAILDVAQYSAEDADVLIRARNKIRSVLKWLAEEGVPA